VTPNALSSADGFRLIFEAALDCVITMDVEGRVVEFNPAAERTFGYRRGDVVGRPLADLIIPPDLRQQHRAGLARHRETGHNTVIGRRLEMWAMRAGGAQFPVELTITQIQGSGGQTLYIGFVRDISDRKQAEDDLRRLNAELEERVRLRTAQLQAAVHELEAFSYSVSHDLRAPLRSIDGFSQALVDDVGPSLPGEAKGHLDRIRAATLRMEHLIEDLLALSRVARSEMTREGIDVTDLAGRIFADLGRQSPDRSVRLTIAPAMTASGDPRLLRVALENLLANAWKFTTGREDAHIEVGRTQNGAAAAFFVRDNGAGFDPQYADKLFAPFQRLHASSEFPGTGIGLATVQRIVSRHGGRVWAEGQPGQGACFYFTLE
jgi:PAS domain S-box-containing protein